MLVFMVWLNAKRAKGGLKNVQTRNSATGERKVKQAQYRYRILPREFPLEASQAKCFVMKAYRS